MKAIIFKVKASILHQFTELKASGRYFIWDRISYGGLFIGSKFILLQRVIRDAVQVRVTLDHTIICISDHVNILSNIFFEGKNVKANIFSHSKSMSPQKRSYKTLDLQSI